MMTSLPSKHYSGHIENLAVNVNVVDQNQYNSVKTGTLTIDGIAVLRRNTAHTERDILYVLWRRHYIRVISYTPLTFDKPFEWIAFKPYNSMVQTRYSAVICSFCSGSFSADSHWKVRQLHAFIDSIRRRSIYCRHSRPDTLYTVWRAFSEPVLAAIVIKSPTLLTVSFLSLHPVVFCFFPLRVHGFYCTFLFMRLSWRILQIINEMKWNNWDAHMVASPRIEEGRARRGSCRIIDFHPYLVHLLLGLFY